MLLDWLAAAQVIQDQSGTEIASNTPLDIGDHEMSEYKLDVLLNVVCQEVIKALKSKAVGSSSSSCSPEPNAAINFTGKLYLPQLTIFVLQTHIW